MPEPLNIVFHRPGPHWRAGVAPFQQDGIQLHVAHYRQWADNGKLLFGGPFLDAGGGGMMVAAQGVGADELQVFAAADPAVASGLLLFEVRPWMAGMRTVQF